MKYFVNNSVAENGNGSKENPFKTIQAAADVAVAGDTVVVAPGVYREWVNPKNRGSVGNPVVFVSEQMGKAHITGAEQAKNWEKVEGNVYVARFPNKMFGNYNPYTTLATLILYSRSFFQLACIAQASAA